MAELLPNRSITARLMAAALVATQLAGCSNDPTRIDYGALSKGVAAQLGGGRCRSADPPPPRRWALPLRP